MHDAYVGYWKGSRKAFCTVIQCNCRNLDQHTQERRKNSITSSYRQGQDLACCCLRAAPQPADNSATQHQLFCPNEPQENYVATSQTLQPPLRL
jgi:hypothetical protein